MAMAEEDLPRVEGDLPRVEGGGEGCLRKGSGVWGWERKEAGGAGETRGRWMGGTPRTGLRTARGV